MMSETRHLHPEGSSFLSPGTQAVLRKQTFDEEGPGTILRDFQTLLDVVGPDGVKTASKHYLLPMKSLADLNARLSRPIELCLKRPQQRSYPHISGLYLLLRATGLGRTEGARSKGRLVVDPALLEAWRALNHTERYCTLLEAWLLHGRGEMLGLARRCSGPLFSECFRVWQLVPARGLEVQPDYEYFFSGGNAYHAALLEMFGLLDLKRAKPREGKAWCPARASRLPLGEALMRLLSLQLLLGLGWLGDGSQEEDEREDEEDEEDDDSDLEADAAGCAFTDAGTITLMDLGDLEWQVERQRDAGEVVYGCYQPLLQPYFPEWRNNLALPQPEFRDGVFVFKLSLGRIWRRIAIPAANDLDKLASAILRSIGFDRDHLMEFAFKDRFGMQVRVEGPECPEGPCTLDVRVGDLPLAIGETMEFLFDYGDNWLFDVELERIDPPDPKLTAPTVLAAGGEAPRQYDWGDEEEWDEDEDEGDGEGFGDEHDREAGAPPV